MVWRVEAEVPEVDEDILGTARGHTKVPGLFGSLLGTAGPYPGSGVFVSQTRMPFFQCTTFSSIKIQCKRGHHLHSATRACGLLPCLS